MGILLFIIILPGLLLCLMGSIAARSKKIVISSNYEVTGMPVSILAKVYIVVGLAILSSAYWPEAFLRNAPLIYPILGIVLALVTIFTLFFSRKRSM